MTERESPRGYRRETSEWLAMQAQLQTRFDKKAVRMMDRLMRTIRRGWRIEGARMLCAAFESAQNPSAALTQQTQRGRTWGDLKERVDALHLSPSSDETYGRTWRDELQLAFARIWIEKHAEHPPNATAIGGMTSADLAKLDPELYASMELLVWRHRFRTAGVRLKDGKLIAPDLLAPPESFLNDGKLWHAALSEAGIIRKESEDD